MATRCPRTSTSITKASVAALGRARVWWRGEGQVSARRPDAFSYVAGFAEVEVDLETGKYHIIDFLAVADVGTVIHPRALGGQMLGRSMLGIGHAIGQKWVYDPQYGLPLSQTLPSQQAADDSRRAGQHAMGRAGHSRSGNTGRCARHRRTAGRRRLRRILNALSDALGDEIFRRAPVNADMILASLEAGRPDAGPLTAHI